MSTRIYKVNVEHRYYGLNWASFKLASRNFAQVLLAARKKLKNNERIESIELLETTN